MTDWCTSCGVAMTGMDFEQCAACDIIDADPAPSTLFDSRVWLPVEHAIRRELERAAKAGLSPHYGGIEERP